MDGEEIRKHRENHHVSDLDTLNRSALILNRRDLSMKSQIPLGSKIKQGATITSLPLPSSPSLIPLRQSKEN